MAEGFGYREWKLKVDAPLSVARLLSGDANWVFWVGRYRKLREMASKMDRLADRLERGAELRVACSRSSFLWSRERRREPDTKDIPREM